MPADLKRKSPPMEEEAASPKRRAMEAAVEEQAESAEDQQEEQTPSTDAPPDPSQDRLARFKALKARQSQSRTQNRKETAAEAQRQQTDPNLLNALNRKHAIASHKLMKADAEAAGEDFERKRAWDWTIDESERWDRRMAKKEKHRDGVAFADFSQEANKTYKRQARDMQVDKEGYEKEKAEAVQRAARSGGLEMIELENGELVAVDRDGGFYATMDSTGFIENKPEKAKVDNLVNDLKKAEESRLRKRALRSGKPEDGDITYINEKNKQFNQKLGRFYDKYTSEIRDNFERGTAV